MKQERIISLFIENEAYFEGSFDVTAKLYEVVPQEEIEAIKYMVPSSTDRGIFFTIVLISKKEKQAGIVGFKG